MTAFKKPQLLRLSVAVFLAATLCILTACPSWFSAPGPQADPTTITVGPDGGSFLFPGGLTLTLPSGALTTTGQIRVKALSRSAFEPILGPAAGTDHNFHLGISIETSLVLRKPFAITTTLPPEWSDGSLPLLSAWNLTSPEGLEGDFSIQIDPPSGLLRISTRLVGALMLRTDPLLTIEAPEVEASSVQSMSSSRPIIGYSGTISVVERSSSHAGTGNDDYSTEVSGEISFPDDSDRPGESWHFEESGKGCTVRLVMSTDATMVQPGEQAAVLARLSLGSRPLKDQEISFSASGVASLSPDQVRSDPTGTAAALVTAAQDEGILTVTASCPAHWHTRRIVINGQVLVDEQVETPVQASTTVLVCQVPVLVLEAGSTLLFPNGGTRITATVIRGETPLVAIPVDFRLEGPGWLDEYRISTTSTGTARNWYTAGADGETVIHAWCTVRLEIGGHELSFSLSGNKTIQVGGLHETWTGTLQFSVAFENVYYPSSWYFYTNGGCRSLSDTAIISFSLQLDTGNEYLTVCPVATEEVHAIVAQGFPGVLTQVADPYSDPNASSILVSHKRSSTVTMDLNPNVARTILVEHELWDDCFDLSPLLVVSCGPEEESPVVAGSVVSMTVNNQYYYPPQNEYQTHSLLIVCDSSLSEEDAAARTSLFEIYSNVDLVAFLLNWAASDLGLAFEDAFGFSLRALPRKEGNYEWTLPAGEGGLSGHATLSLGKTP